MAKLLSHPLVCVVGPTASGKTALAQCMAEHLSYSILSADSMQVYAGMDIGTGKIPVQDRSVPYFGLDLVNPGEPYSASLFQEYGRSVIDKLDAAGSGCVVCGGTGFYIRALIDKFEFPAGEQVGNPVRDHYSALLRSQGPLAVWEELRSVDPDSAALIPPNDSKRVIRALELQSEGLSYAAQKEQFAAIEQYYSPLCMIGLAVDSAVLIDWINNRVDTMVEDGLIAEVEHLLDHGYRSAITANQAIGYKEIVAALDGSCSIDEAIDDIKLATRQYAKRQRTWFRKDKRIHWIDATSASIENLTQKALSLVFNEVE